MNTQILSHSREFQEYALIVDIFSLIFVLVCVVTTQLVKLSLDLCVLSSAGVLKDNMKIFCTCWTYLVQSVGDEGHMFVYLFTFILVGLVVMMGQYIGISGSAIPMSDFSRSSFSGQLSCYFAGTFTYRWLYLPSCLWTNNTFYIRCHNKIFLIRTYHRMQCN